MNQASALKLTCYQQEEFRDCNWRTILYATDPSKIEYKSVCLVQKPSMRLKTYTSNIKSVTNVVLILNGGGTDVSSCFAC